MNMSCQRSSASSRRLGLGLFAAFLLAATIPGAARGETQADAPKWYESYRLAVAEAELENWEGVETRIRGAIAAKPDSQRNVRTYGMWHASYIPYYYLGLAQHRMGRDDEALRSFEREEAAGVVQHDPVAYLKLKKMTTRIREGASSPRPATAAAAPPTTAASRSGDGLMEGLQAFFQGDYDRSIAAFQEALKAAPPEDLTLHLYLGMAYAGKSAQDAGNADLWRNMAFLEFRQVHAIDPGYELSAGIFSDRMVGLFEEAGREP